MTSRRHGFTLAEIVVALVIAGVIGAAFTKLLMQQNRYYDGETNRRAARSLARGAMNVMLSDLRMVQDSGGVDSVSADGRTIRVLVPYEFGLVCRTQGSTTTVLMLPVDSAMASMSVYRGFAWRDSASGRYNYNWPSNPTSQTPGAAGTPSDCTGGGFGQAQLTNVSMNGRQGQFFDVPSNGPSGASVGAPVFFFQRITYSFGASSQYPGRLSLWRNVENGPNDEIMSPFDSTSGFRFYTTGSDASVAAPPALSNIRGVDLVLNARSPRGTSQDSTRKQSKVMTSVFFKNVRGF
jgi:prepilin-type N-terminal cleavage/methylation domain-containing protein